MSERGEVVDGGGGGLRREDRAVKHFRSRHSRVMKHSKRIYLCDV